MATESHTTRRALFATAGAASAALALPVAAAASPAVTANTAQVLQWEREATNWATIANARETDEDATDHAANAAADLECLIANAPCDSLTVALVKLRTVVRESLVSGCLYKIDAPDLVDGIIAYLATAEGKG